MSLSPELGPISFDRRTFLRAAVLAGVGGVGVAGCSDNEAAPPPAPGDTQTDPSTGATAESQISGEFSAQPTWEQDFASMPDGDIDTSVWRFEDSPEVPGYNNEAQGYSHNNAYIKDGKLTLEARKEPFVYPNDSEARRFEYTSGRIDTSLSCVFSYGKVEARMKMPQGAGVWPAFWLQSVTTPHTPDDATAEEWETPGFYESDGEVDIVEYYGHTPGAVELTVHTNETALHEGATGNAVQAAVPDAETAFHTYGVELSPHQVVWTIDGKEYHRFEKTSDDPMKWPFTPDNQFKAVLNLAMGGESAGPIDDAGQPWKFEVENVSFFEYTGAK